MIPSHLRFDILKERVCVERLLAHFGLLTHFRLRAGKLRGPCPLHHGDRADSFVIEPQRGLWYCFSACQRGGDLISLAQRLSGLPFREVAELLADLADAPPPPAAGPHKRSPKPSQRPFRPFTRRLPLDPHAAFLRAKGIPQAIAARFEVGAYHGHGFLQSCIGVRLHDPEGRPVGYMGRRLRPDDIARWGKYKVASGLPKGSLLYGWHRRPSRDAQPLIVTECVWGVLRLAALALPAVSLLGCHASSRQLALLRTVPHLTVVLDGDRAGRTGARRLVRQLQPACRVRIVSLPEGSDADDLEDEALRVLLCRS